MTNSNHQSCRESSTKKKKILNTARHKNGIAVVGMACRFPGASNYDQFWHNLKYGRKSIQEIPGDRWDWKAFWGDPKTEINKSNSKWGGFIDNVGHFDAEFFNFSPREAEAMDPQQRIMLEITWACLEDAGIGPSQISGENVGVYIGVFNFDYKELKEKEKCNIEAYHSTGTASAIIANRISHYFNLKGPSIPVDAACSSSLFAIHSAIQSLNSKECCIALVGGISLLLTPTRHISFSKTGMLSPTGVCKTFDENADGYVRGEGAGMIILKPLESAIADGDSIYGVLKGSAVNHNGRTHTLTYPSADAQADVIVAAVERACVAADSISFIEAHGTGTPKGDPIEFQGLIKAFERLLPKRKKNMKKNFCGLGSLKTNVGHLEAAAGIAGVIKVLLSMKHGQLPALQNFGEINHRIPIKNSPFYIVEKLQEWNTPKDRKRKNMPMRAGISSFGFGGTNAHVVVEEAPVDRKPAGKASPYHIICLSAKTKDALKRKQEDIKFWLQENGEHSKLADIQSALLFGREHFDIRSAFVVRNMVELRNRLDKVLEKREAEGYFDVNHIISGNLTRPYLEELVKKIIGKLSLNRKKNEEEYRMGLMALAEIYVNGYNPDWKKIFCEKKISRINLPTYPFAGERYWGTETEVDICSEKSMCGLAPNLHPLLHKNTSDLSEQRFSSVFTGKEFFLEDHVINEQKVLPGAAYLEMVCAAVEKATGGIESQLRPIIIRDVIWSRPIIVTEQPVEVHIGIYPGANYGLGYTVYSGSEKDRDRAVIHSRGNVNLSSPEEIQKIDLLSIRKQCNQTNLTSEQCYEALNQIGFQYGERHKGIEKIYMGEGQILAKLSLPDLASNMKHRFILHPGIIDSAFQASLMLNSMRPRMALPFSLQELSVSGICPSEMWAVIRSIAGNGCDDRLHKVDIDLCDTEGRICVRVKGLVFKVPENKIAVEINTAKHGSLMLTPCWEKKDLSEKVQNAEYARQIVILGGMNKISVESIESQLSSAKCIALETDAESLSKRFQGYVLRTFEEIQDVFKNKNSGKILLQIVVRTKDGYQFAGLCGLLKTAHLENPKFVGQLIEIDSTNSIETIVEILNENSHRPLDCHVRYQNGTRYVAGWSEVENSRTTSVPWSDNGVYLITGGAGGLGMHFAKDIAKNAKGANIILVGRSSPDENKKASMKELEIAGARILYIQTDVGNKKDVQGLIKSIKDEFKKINGIIHCAGVIRDNFIIKKNKTEFLEVLSPKVNGLVNLDQETKDMSLELFILFSSVAGVFGNSGQADYAAANAFMDAYAGYRNALKAMKQRKGITLTVNWSLWKDGGMRMNDENEQMMERNTGMAAIQTGNGINALYQGLSSGREQILVLEGDLSLIREKLLGQKAKAEAGIAMDEIVKDSTPEKVCCSFSENNMGASTDIPDLFVDKATEYFKKLLSYTIKKPSHLIETDAPLEKYGIDSIMVMKMTDLLEQDFGTLSKTLFFEYRNINELTAYFIKDHRKRLAELISYGKNAERRIGNHSDGKSTTRSENKVFCSRGRRFIEQKKKSRKEKGPLDIAIIGVSGRYPKAKNKEEFWKNLKEGKNCITEIPENRWDHRLYFDEDRNRPGKIYSKWGGFLENIDRFDPQFFNISPREAVIIDPQERLFLQCVYTTLEDAGYTRDSLAASRDYGLEGNVGVYVGVMYQEYQLFAAQEQLLGRPFACWGIPSSIANRVSYFFNFHGPCMAVDTMCSSSLTAIHLACQSLHQGDCELAIAGGVNVSIHPNKYLFLSQGKFVSSKGRCESFGKGGNGYVPGEGVGAVLLKPLDRATTDGDHIYGILKAAAVNHGGKTNGYTVPNPNAQSAVIEQAIENSGIDPRTISYIEAHGTGTSLGDPIEITGLAKAFGKYTQDKQFCAIGSVKSNIGHCESAAGIAGVTKVLLQFKHGQLVPSLHSEMLNPNIDFSATPFFVQHSFEQWIPPKVEKNGTGMEYPRIAGISSFGAGGSNAHIIIEEYAGRPQPVRMMEIAGENPVGIVLSARNEDRLQARAWQLIVAIEEDQYYDSRLEDIAYTLQVGREAMKERLAVVVTSIGELKEKLKSYVEGHDAIENLYRGRVQRHYEASAVFDTNADQQQAVDRWLGKRNYSKLLELWVKGSDIDWNKLYGDIKPNRVGLPGYPFAGKSYWIPEGVRGTGKDEEKRSNDNGAVHSINLQNESKPHEETISPALNTGKPNGIHLMSLKESGGSEEQKSTRPAPVSLAGNAISPTVRIDKEKTPLEVQPEFPNETLQAELQGSLAEALYLSREEVDIDAKFVDMGLDSIIGVEWIKEINKRYHTSLPATRVYDYPSIREFVEFLNKELSEKSRQAGIRSQSTHQSKNSSLDEEKIPINPNSLDKALVEQRENGTETRIPSTDMVIPGDHYGLVLSTVHSVDELLLQQWVMPEPKSNEITVRVKASAINFPDVMCVKGLYPTMPDYPFVPGFEVSGVVTGRGDKVKGFNLGDEVIAVTGKQMGGHSGFANVPVINAVHKPKNISFEEACSLPVVFLTINHAFSLGRPAPNEHVLIQTATGGCGLMAIQLARLKGCACHGTSSKTEKLSILEKIGIPFPINYQTVDYADELKNRTEKRGIDVVLNTLSGDHIQKGLNCLAPSGRYLEIAVHALKTSPRLNLSKLINNQSIYSIDIRRLILQDSLKVNKGLGLMIEMLQAEKIVPIVSRIYPVAQIKEALEYVSQGRHIGKVVISHTRKTMTDLTDDCMQRLIKQKRNCEKKIVSTGTTLPAKKEIEQGRLKEKIAVVGMAGKFPMSENIEAFWENIANGRDCVATVPENRWSLEEYYDPDPKAPGKTNCRWMGVLDDADKFDPLFFGISPAEAEVMDPQQRLFLENSWLCIEDAGLNPAALSGIRCGVFAGCARNDYGQFKRGRELNAQGLMGSAASILAARISYLLNLRGPCLAIDTACSSSLVALSEACNSLILGTSDMALAGGVCVMAGPSMHIMTSKAGMLSPDGRCFSFDNRANGFVPGEGAGVVLLKRLSDALRDSDPIHGLIVGWGINQDGKTNGITAPSVNSQIALEKDVYERFNIDPGTISLVEAHGTGTKLGDPVEVEALTESFRAYTDKKNYCALGSVKSNIGHLLAASGISGAIKVLSALKHRVLPPLVHHKTLNEHIRLEDSPFYINNESKSWKVDSGMPRRACVSSFGFSGTNAHVVMEEYIPSELDPPLPEISSGSPAIILLSAQNENRLNAQARQLLDIVEKEKISGESLSNMAYTLQVGREAMEERLAVIVSSMEELKEKLGSFIDGRDHIDKFYRGQVKRNRENMAVFAEDEELAEAVRKWVQRGKYGKLLSLWVKGLSVDWNQLYDDIKPRRIHLPVYPFAKERYRLTDPDIDRSVAIQATEATADSTNSSLQQNTSDFSGTLMFQPVWNERGIPRRVTAPSYERHLVMLCEPGNVLEDEIAGKMNGAGCLILQSDGNDVAKRFIKYAEEVFARIRSFLRDKPKGRVLIQIVVPADGEKILFSGLRALLITARMENPKISGQLIEVESEETCERLIEILHENQLRPMDEHIRYQKGKRMVAGWCELETSPEKASLPWRDRGVYLITGGTGGLGMILAREIAQKVEDSTLVLAGRSPLSAKNQQHLKELTSLGARIEYQEIDVAQKEAVNGLIRSILENFGYLSGIIHAAGITKDSFMLKKTRQELQAVLGPKVSGLAYLDQATKNLPLDFFVFFSSIAGVIGNIGQADYAAANAFMDTYAKYRNDLVAVKHRKGTTLSINWPLWKKGGMRIDADVLEIIRKNTGMSDMRTSSGIQAFYQGLAFGKDQVMVVEGEVPKVRERFLRIISKAHDQPLRASVKEMDPELLRVETVYRLKKLFCEITKLRVDQIDEDEMLESYGIDSTLITQLNQKLGDIFGELSKTLFFEYQTLRALAEYFIADYPDDCVHWAGLGQQMQTLESATGAVLRADNRISDSTSLRAGKGRSRDCTGATEEDKAPEPIAIIGMSGRYPQAKNLQDYWKNLKKGKNCITEIPENRWTLEGFYHPDFDQAVTLGKSYCKWGGFIEGFADFDPYFFNMSPREAGNIDPQERLFLEACWEVLEDAGYTREQLETQYQGRVGVFVGITKTGFDLYGPDLWKRGEKVFPHTSFGSAANRISFLLNLQGPSMPIDTMCSSSLIAIHEACAHILHGECEMAIAGGVNLYLHPATYLQLCRMQMLSTDGRCKSFGKEADGFVPGEGVGCVLLKRLTRAIADRDHIHAVIKGSGVNHGGKTNGYTVPNPSAQKKVIRAALDKAGVDARTISYIEAHGTGTLLGDPIEITGLTQAFRTDTPDNRFCALGSVKSNIGHLEAAAGIAGLAKIVLQMKYQKLVPSLSSQELNPNINFDHTPFQVQQEITDWKSPVIEIDGKKRKFPRRAGISSFGAGGANAHLVVEEYIPENRKRYSLEINKESPVIIVVSARNENQLEDQVKQLLATIQSHSDINLADMAYTLQVGREAMEERMGLIVGSMDEIEDKFDKFLTRKNDNGDIHRGNINNKEETLAAHSAEGDIAGIIDVCIRKKEYYRIIDLWVKGLCLDWDKLYGDVKPQRISLPTYPFSKKQYWIRKEKKLHEIVSAPQKDAKSSDAFYEKIIDEVINDKLSIDEAVSQIIN
jgi:acyl transferase domain-containing protein/D-arabinose 1-dehydrogenase-like Zn-dependent alcohol dehydrogenase/acyl carrier protein